MISLLRNYVFLFVGSLIIQEHQDGKRGLPTDLTSTCSSCETMKVSMHSVVWVRCTKHKHHGAQVVQCTAASAVCHFHSGDRSRESDEEIGNTSLHLEIYKEIVTLKGQNTYQTSR